MTDTVHEEPPRTSYEEYERRTTYKSKKRTAHQLRVLDRHKALAESHPFQFQRWDVGPFRGMRTNGFRPSELLATREELRTWLDEHAPGWIEIDEAGNECKRYGRWIIIPDLVSAMAFKMR